MVKFKNCIVNFVNLLYSMHICGFGKLVNSIPYDNSKYDVKTYLYINYSTKSLTNIVFLSVILFRLW